MNENIEDRRSLYVVIPARAWDDKKLRPNAKLLYGELSALACEEGYCWATNCYLAKRLNLASKTIEGLLKQLKDLEYISIDVERDNQTREVIRRKIWICGPPGISVPPPLKNEGRSPQNEGYPPLKNKDKSNTSISNIPPIIPQKGDGTQRKGRRKKSIPTWNPERFERFWAAYPRDENRARAVEEWDKLGKDKELLDKHGGSEKALLDEIARGLQRHLLCEDWKNGIGIPHAFRWLRDRRWTEKKKEKSDYSISPAPEHPKKYHYEMIDGEEVLVWDE